MLLGSVARSGDERLRFALMAGSYVELLWAKTLRAVNSLAAERAYFSMTEHERRAVEESTGYDAWLEAQVSKIAFASCRKGALWFDCFLPCLAGRAGTAQLAVDDGGVGRVLDVSGCRPAQRR